MSLYERLISWLVPYTPEETAQIVEHTRLLKAEADLKEALVEEVRVRTKEAKLQQKREQEQKTLFRNTATYWFDNMVVVRPKGNSYSKETLNVEVSAILQENDMGDRRFDFHVVNKDTRAQVPISSSKVSEYLRHYNVYQHYLEPWVQGALDIDDLEGVAGLAIIKSKNRDMKNA